MNQGQFIIVRAQEEIDQRLEYLRALLVEWDWSMPLSIKYGKYTAPRTLSQNALFHLWMSEGEKHFKRQGADVDADRLKTLLKYKMLGTVDIQVGSQTVPGVLRGTSKLDKSEMYDFMSRCEAWLLDMGVRLTIPADSEYGKMREANQ